MLESTTNESTTAGPATKTSGLAIAGLVLGILAAVTSFLPIINNLSAVVAVIGGVLAAVSLVGALRGKHSSRGLAIAGVVLAVVSFAIVLATQSMYKSVIDTALEEATSGSEIVATTESESDSGEETEASDNNASGTDNKNAQENEPATSEDKSSTEDEPDAEDFTNMAVGSTAELNNGISITVNSAQTGLVNYDDSLITCVNVTYVNNGSKNASFNPYDWKGEDANGAQRSMAYFSDEESPLSSGTLSPGGSVTGNLYFDDGIVRVLYYSNMFNDAPTAGWAL